MSFLRSVTELAPGDHACLVYDSEERRDEVVRSFLLAGLARGDRLLYVDNGSDGSVADGLEPHAVPGQLAIVAADDTYLSGGRFVADRALAGLRQAVDDSLARGFLAVRAAGGPPFAVTRNGQSHLLAEYERRANDLFSARTLAALCAYDT